MLSLRDGEKFERLGPGVGAVTSAAHGFTTDTLLLAAFSLPRAGEKCADLGTGCGVIPALWCLRSAPASVLAVELQELACSQAERGFAENGQAAVRVLRGDIRAFRSWGVAAGSLDSCAANPPYKAVGTGLQNSDEPARLARHENTCSFAQLAEAAAWLLRWGGRFCCCQRPQRLPEVLAACAAVGLEPKRLRLVQQRPAKAPFLFLLEARRGGKPGLVVPPVLLMEGAAGGLSREIEEIYGEYKSGNK